MTNKIDNMPEIEIAAPGNNSPNTASECRKHIAKERDINSKFPLQKWHFGGLSSGLTF